MSEARREQILQGSNFERIFNVKLGDTFRLVENLESIKTKTQALVKLKNDNASAHDALDTAMLSQEAVTAANEALTSRVISNTEEQVQYTRDNPYVFKEGISDADAKIAFDNLPIGSIYIDPLDGEPYRKDK